MIEPTIANKALERVFARTMGIIMESGLAKPSEEAAPRQNFYRGGVSGTSAISLAAKPPGRVASLAALDVPGPAPGDDLETRGFPPCDKSWNLLTRP